MRFSHLFSKSGNYLHGPPGLPYIALVQVINAAKPTFQGQQGLGESNRGLGASYYWAPFPSKKVKNRAQIPEIQPHFFPPPQPHHPTLSYGL